MTSNPTSTFEPLVVENSWKILDQYLTSTRYAVRDPQSGEPLESDYLEIVKGRLAPKLLSLPDPLPGTNLIKELIRAVEDRLIIAASPLLMSFGNPHTRRPGYFSCYPLGRVGDSLEEIEKVRHQMRMIYMAGGGAGIDVSLLRPKGAPVDGSQGVASGPVGFLPDFDAVTGTTNQGGRRRGALLVQMDWNHPDIIDFVKAKNFNAKLNSFIQSLPVEERPVQSPHLSNMNISVNVFGGFWDNKALIRTIAENMWATGDPGVLFVDNMLAYSPLRAEDEPRFSNPCGEYLASAYTACNLVTINVARLARLIYDQLIKEGFSPAASDWPNKFCPLFWKELFKLSSLASLFGNMILDFDEGYPLEEIRINSQAKKPVGVGLSGFHSALILAYWGNVAYGSDEAARFAKMTQAALTMGTLKLSAMLTRKNNHSYENFEYWRGHLGELSETASDNWAADFFGPEIDDLKQLVEEKGGFYNCLTTSQAPTGSTSAFLRNIDTGIEPFFSLAQERRVNDAKKNWITFTLAPAELCGLFLAYPDLLARTEAQTALKLSPREQLKMLAAFQYHSHTGVSKTINLPTETTVEEIEELLYLSRSLRLKGFTVYRDASLQGVISDAYVSNDNKKKCPKLKLPFGDDVGDEREGRIFTARSSSFTSHIVLSNDEQNNIREVFVTAGEVGADINAIFSAFGMILSVALRSCPPLFEPLAKTLCKVNMDQRVRIETNMSPEPIVGSSLPQAIGMLMLQRKQFLEQNPRGNTRQSAAPVEASGQANIKGAFDLCPECNQLTMRREGNCRKCLSCGLSTC
ncbi:MAG: hypothetical protein LBV23_11115 [Deltaproteobacteria bacterium]|jgi:ribonucleoside-diphosphate reductase alpha chain|nr:hypothetical protein [Deltaproteobacteria bacterium]